MKKIGGVFYFSFSFEDEEVNDEIPINNWGFNLTPEAIKILGEDFAGEDWFEACFWDIEAEFGVHDWCSYPCDELVGVGYDTYEVERSLAPKCVERWRQVFIEKVGVKNVSNQVFDLGSEGIESDLDAFNRVKKLGG